MFLNNHKSGNQSDTNARDAAIILSFALQHGADLQEIRNALCRDSMGRALGPVAAALDIIAKNGGYMTDEQKARGSFSAAKEQWLKLVASYPNLSACDIAVAVVIATYMNAHTGYAWPSMKTLATDTNRERSTIWRSIKRLEALELLAVVHSRSAKKPNVYRMRLGKLDAEPKALRIKKPGAILRLHGRNASAAQTQHIGCSGAARTSKNLR